MAASQAQRRKAIYGVSVAGGPVRLIRAATQAQAIAFVLGNTVFAGRPSEEELIALTKQGVEVEDIPAAPIDLVSEATTAPEAEQVN